jgi:hypothetical protein
LLDGAAEGNAVVVAELLAQGGVAASVRTVQMLVITKKRRKSDRVKALALERAGFRFRFRRIDLPAALGASLSGGG